MFEEVEEIIERSGEDNWAVPVEKVEDGAREVKVRGLNHLSTPKLEDGVDGENDLEQGEGLGSGMVFKDMFTSNGQEGDELRSVGEEVGTIESCMGEGSRDVRVFDGTEVPEPPEVESGVRERGIRKGEVSQGRME